jgi:predicted solute-binding protein
VERLRADELDVALVSSIELFRRHGYGYLEGAAVAARGGIASVQVFLRAGLPELRAVALDPASRAAQALTQIVLPRRVGRRLAFESGGEDSLACQAWLEIGDRALRRRLSPEAPPSFDPAQAWTEDTGLGFVFAAWVVRPGLVPEPEERQMFAQARERGAREIDALAARASQAWGLGLQACRRYLGEECRYDPGPELPRALVAFRDAAAALDLCLPGIEPRAFPLTT